MGPLCTSVWIMFLTYTYARSTYLHLGTANTIRYVISVINLTFYDRPDWYSLDLLSFFSFYIES